MLYIKFKIQDLEKYQDFQIVYDHMVQLRQPNFEFEEEVIPEFDWDNLSKEETNAALEKIDEFFDQDADDRRYAELFPEYADAFLKSYIEKDQSIAGAYGFDIKGIFNYLEFGFEVDLDNLKILEDNIGLIEFSTGNYPFGGLERFIMVLKSFDLISLECFDGFHIFKLNWLSEFEFTPTSLEEKTKAYLKK